MTPFHHIFVTMQTSIPKLWFNNWPSDERKVSWDDKYPRTLEKVTATTRNCHTTLTIVFSVCSKGGGGVNYKEGEGE